MSYQAAFVLFVLPMIVMGADAKSGVDLSAMDKSVEPCSDFYQYACGNWIAHNPLPADRPRWARVDELIDRHEAVLLDILRNAAKVEAGRSAAEQKLGDYYASCMDTAGINKKGLAPLQPELERINAMTSKQDVEVELARLHRMRIRVLFNFGAEADAKDVNRMIASLSQGGLSLPDREYYLQADAKSVEIRQAFLKHMTKMFKLAGVSPENAADRAQGVLGIETLIARAWSDRVSMRDPNSRYHIFTKAELSALSSWGWETYFKDIGAPAFETINVTVPAFIKRIPSIFSETPIETWKAYFTYQLLRHSAPQLTGSFESEAFDFWERYLLGVRHPRPRAVRCLETVHRALADLLRQKYLDVAFESPAQRQVTQIVETIEKSMASNIEKLSWMTDETKSGALAKLNAITNNIARPRKWRDYGNVSVARDNFFDNELRTRERRQQENLDRIGKSSDKTSWPAGAHSILDAFYEPYNNSINLTAGILQYPFFDPLRDIAVNYGAIGFTIGHEITHGFDDQGRKFDGEGNLRDWWTPADAAEFGKRAACIADQYSRYTWVDGVKLNGRLTLGENIADNGGVRIALMALQDRLKGDTDKLQEYTPEQRFFVGFAQAFCENVSPEDARQRALTDGHSPARFRVNGSLQNMPEFQKAFACKAQQPMVSASPCHVW